MSNANIYSFLVDSSEHKKAKDVNNNVVATVSPDEHKDKHKDFWIKKGKDTQLTEFKLKTIQ